MKMWVPTRFQIWFSSKVIYCGAMCTTNITCQAFYFDSTKCYEADALNLIGAFSESQTKKKVYMDKSLTKGDSKIISKITCHFDFSLLIFLQFETTNFKKNAYNISWANFQFQPMEYGCGLAGQHALLHVEQALAPDQQHVMDLSMQGWIAVAAGQRLSHVKVGLFNKWNSKGVFISLFAVEGVWSVWGAWSVCTTSCNTGSRTRTRNYTGGQPCTGSSSDTGNCVSKFS